MSNVLIGVLAVILLIGLGIAGALYFGSKFSGLSNDAKAAKVVAEGSQIQSAYEMRRVTTGKTLTLGNGAQELETLKTEGYLKAIPDGIQESWVIGQSGVA